MSNAKTLYVRSGGRWVATGGGGGSPVTEHDAALPQPQAPLPSEIERIYAPYAEGLHYFKQSGSMVSIQRQRLQTTVVVNGPVRSVARVVSGENGQPTPDNPSTLITCDTNGVWSKLTSDSPSNPFSPPQTIDLFELPLQIAQFVNDAIAAIPPLDPDEVVAAIDGRSISPLSIIVGGPVVFGSQYAMAIATTVNGPRPTVTYNNGNSFFVCAAMEDVYTKTESDTRFLNQQYFLDNAYYGPSIVFKDTNGLIRWRTPNLGDGKGPDAVLSTALWTNSPSSAPIPRLYFESDGTAGGYLAYREELDAYLKTGSAAEDIKGQGIEPLVVRVGSGGVVYQDSYQLYVDNVGIGPRAVIEYSNLGVVTRIICMAQGDAYTKTEVDALIAAIGTVGATSVPDLSGYAKLNDSTQNITASTIEATAVAIGSSQTVLAFVDTGEGFGERLVLSAFGKNEYITLRSDLEGLMAILDDATQKITADTINVSGVEFRKSGSANVDTLAVVDVNGQARLAVKSGSKTFTLAYTTELPPDLSAYAAKVDKEQSLLTNTVTAKAFGFGTNIMPTVALAYTDTGEGFGERLVLATPDRNEHLVFASDLAKIQSYVDTNYATKASLEKSQVLYWDSPSTAPVTLGTDATKNKWLVCGKTSPVAFVAGRVYRIDCRLRLGSLNADVLQQWYGVRATAGAGAPLPISGIPLMNLTGLGTSTVTGARKEIKATGLVDGPTSIYRFVPTDDWVSDGETLAYCLEFLASETKTCEVEFGFAWGGIWNTNPANVQAVVAVVRGV